jgi:gentisate 1,2-dioxygenase
MKLTGLEQFYELLRKERAAPLWQVMSNLIPRVPENAALPALWPSKTIRPLVMESGNVISAEDAERRVLILENPGLAGTSRIAQTLFAGVQLVLPGEVARCHRHVAAALRFVIEGSGAYTAVNGERTFMRPGDFILTPSWSFHDHGNPGSEPVIWMDGLDVPVVNFFGAGFTEHSVEETQVISRADDDAQLRYGSNMLPLEHRSGSMSSPVFNYPYARSREALDQSGRNSPLDQRHGFKMQYINPATGGYPMPTIGAFLQLLPAGFQGSRYRSTDSTVFCVVEGRGRSAAGDQTFEWESHDIFVVPSWCPVSHEAAEESVLFSYYIFVSAHFK